MIKVVPVPIEVPPVNAAYQLIVPADAVALNDTFPVPQLEAGEVAVILGGVARTVIVPVAFTDPQPPVKGML